MLCKIFVDKFRLAFRKPAKKHEHLSDVVFGLALPIDNRYAATVHPPSELNQRITEYHLLMIKINRTPCWSFKMMRADKKLLVLAPDF